MTTDPDFNVNRPLVESSTRKAMDELLVTIQVQGGMIANMTDRKAEIEQLDKREQALHNALNAARDAARKARS